MIQTSTFHEADSVLLENCKMGGAEGKKLLLGLSVRGERRPCVLGGFLQRNRADKIFFCLEEINHEDLHTSMETDCPHSAGGRLETQRS